MDKKSKNHKKYGKILTWLKKFKFNGEKVKESSTVVCP
jgi:hypothetical protein